MAAVHMRLDDLRLGRMSRDLLREEAAISHAVALMLRPAKEAAGENSLPHTRQIVERALRHIDFPALQGWDLAPWPEHGPQYRRQSVMSVAGLPGSGLEACRYLVEPGGQVHAAPDAWSVLSRRGERRLPEDDVWWHHVFEPFAAELEAAWRQTVGRRLAQYATPPGAWWAIRLDWAIDPGKALDLPGPIGYDPEAGFH